MRTRTIGLILGALLTAAAVSTACSGLGPSATRTRQWAEGPVRWLLLPAEVRELRDLRNDAEGRLFIEEFWRRRDPDPASADHPLRTVFARRVEVADRAYGDEGRRGSLTDRGHALVVLGSPPLLRHGRHTAPAWRPGQRRESPSGGRRMPVRNLVVETWEYSRADLWPALVARLDERDEPGITLVFVVSEGGTRLIEGDKYLEWAAETLVQLVPTPGPESESESI